MRGAAGVRPYRVVAERIRAFIVSEGLAAGARLVAERQLAERLAVSRSALREGLVALELEGVVRVAGGSGVYVCAAPAVPPVRHDPSPRELHAARRLVLAQLAAALGRPAARAGMAWVQPMLAAGERAGWATMPGREFMLALGAATGNAALLGVVDCLWRDELH